MKFIRKYNMIDTDTLELRTGEIWAKFQDGNWHWFAMKPNTQIEFDF